MNRNNRGHSVREVVEVARKITGHPIPVIETGRRAGDPAVLVASSDKIRRELGWRPDYEDLETIVKTAWTWHQQEALIDENKKMIFAQNEMVRQGRAAR